MKKRLLFYGHMFHKKTKSNIFFLNVLQREYDIYKVYENPFDSSIDGLKDTQGIYFDVLVLYQLIPNREIINACFSFEQGILVPMYDGFDSTRYWWEYFDFKVLCFSDAVEKIAKADGLATFNIKYYTKPADAFEYGSENSVFLWQRRTAIDGNLALDLLKDYKINKLHIHKALDPNETFVEPVTCNIEIEYSEWYSNPLDMLQNMCKSVFYIAPRQYEGIGMSFLEAMSNGRCVVAPNLPTMNEYIIDGINGILYDWDTMRLLQRDYDIRKIQDNAYKTICDGHKQWIMKQKEMLRWIADEKIVINHYGNDRYNRLKDTTYMISQMEKKSGTEKFRSLFCLEDEWLKMIFEGKSVENNLLEMGYSKIAIYGMSRVGCNLERCLSRNADIEISYAIDRRKNKIQHMFSFDIFEPDEVLPQVDAVIVTAIMDFENIKLKLIDKGLRAISIKDVIK